MKKQIVFLIKVMNGGGAERVVSLLSKAFADAGKRVTLILTHQSLSEAELSAVDKRIEVISLPDEINKGTTVSQKPKLIMLWARLVGKLRIKHGAEKSSILKYCSRNYKHVKWLRNYFRKNKNTTAVAFLYDSIFMTLLTTGKNNKVVISERGDPCQSLLSKTTMAFMKNKFKDADKIVFQSPDVKEWYEQNIGVSGTVIFNPVKPDLPEAYNGERQKKIVNFCRISEEKNITLLVEAFTIFHNDYNDYDLYLIGNSFDDYSLKIEESIIKNKCSEYVHILPAKKDVHIFIREFSMFVSSSNHEGMSNSMLEAMAIGLPCVCTDCPAGGARAVIRDGENGLLVPIKDAEALAKAMKRIVEEEGLAEKLSRNAVKIREEQSLDKIIEKWTEIIDD
ncbi:MAG: glycosyltransferase [Clostridia bacterium]|nr:glycosyltransferase [Clostridia bacterium]